jgi:hypothetical protein
MARIQREHLMNPFGRALSPSAGAAHSPSGSVVSLTRLLRSCGHQEPFSGTNAGRGIPKRRKST